MVENRHNIQTRWGEKRYHSMDYDLKKRYGEKVYRIALDGGMTCPNRDGTIGSGGCIFCSANGSGDFAGSARLLCFRTACTWETTSEKQTPGARIYRLFSGFHQYLRSCGISGKDLYAGSFRPGRTVLSIATRPDCLDEDILALLERINRIKPVWVELGLQTIHANTAAYIRRGYELPVFERAVNDLRARGIEVIVHTILCLPGETKQLMFETLDYLNHMDIQGIKLQLLHILKGTDLAVDYERQPFWSPSMEEYIELLGSCIIRLRPDLSIHRLTGDGPKDLLIAPLWTSRKREVLNTLHRYLKEQDLWQGKGIS